MRRGRFVSGVAALTAVIALAHGCVAHSRIEQPGEPSISKTLGPSIFYEEGKLVFLGVNAGLVRFSEGEELIPLEIGIANKEFSRLTLGSEGFTLQGGGERWPPAPVTDRAGHTLRADFARRTQPLSFLELMHRRFPHYREIAPNVGGASGDRTLVRTVEMGQYTWMLLQLWFPRPPGELEGREFELWFAAPELSDPVFTTIRF